MLEIQTQKSVVMLPMQLKDDAAFDNNTYIDTAGWNHLRVEFHIGTLDAAIGTTDDSTAPLIEECDTTGGTYTAVTDAALDAVIAATKDDTIKAIDIPLTQSHKRYMRVKAPTAGDGAVGCNLLIVGRLSRPQIAPVDAAGQGLDELVSA